jgi:3-hydroxyethyl bacteriochlorophyllide a dehydrogenase
VGENSIETVAVILRNPGAIELGSVPLDDPGPDDIVVEIAHTGISTGTEKLFWSGTMPPFPGMGYPLIPGYEAVGEVVQAGAGSVLRTGDTVFVPGASCYGPVRGLFGGAVRRLVTHPDRALKVDAALGADAVLIALAATARHAIAGVGRGLPDLIVGHGVLGRLLARLTIAAGGRTPTVWEINPQRRGGAAGYAVLDPDEDVRRDYGCIYDATGDGRLLDTLVGRIAKGGEIVLAGFYAEPLTFAFPPAFMKEARLRIAAEWTRDDLIATRALIDSGALSLDGLITHAAPAAEAMTAYPKAFTDPACLKMTLDWSAIA